MYQEIAALRKHKQIRTMITLVWRETPPRVKVTYNRFRWRKYILYHIANFFISSWNTIKLEHYIDSYYKILHAKVGINIYAKTMQLEVF